MFCLIKWVKQNKLCVEMNTIDMSVSYRITAPKSWVEKNCPELLTKYTQFICTPDEDGVILDRFGKEFLPYSEENIGLHYVPEY